MKTRYFTLLLLLYNIEHAFTCAVSFPLDTVPQVWIDSFGRVGIGTQAPEDKLHVQGNLRLNGKLIVNSMPGDSGAVLVSRGAAQSPVWDSTFRKGLWEELDNKIRYTNKNVEVQKTLYQYGNADGFEGTGLNYYNRWMPNATGGSDVPSFNMCGGRFLNGTGQPDNIVWNFGPNLAAGGGTDQSGRSAFGLSFEYRFFIDNVPYNEFHILHVDSINQLQRRPLYCLFAHDASRLSWNHHLTDWSIFDKDNTKVVFSINTVDETQRYNFNNSNQFRHIFNNTDYQPIWQKSASGNIQPLVGYVGNYLQMGNPSESILMKIGQDMELGNNGEFNYVGPSPGSGILNFRIGKSGNEYNTIWHHSQSEINTRFVTQTNNFGWGIGLSGEGAFYLRDFISETTPFYLSGEAPENSFLMGPTGNISLGGSDVTEKLVVNGNLKLAGSILLGSQGGLPGQSLSSQGPGLPNIWEYTIKTRHEMSFTAIEDQTSFIIDENLPDPLGSQIPVQVFRNGIKLKYVTSSPSGRQFTYMDNEITTSACDAGDEIEIVYYISF
jgi:hypothetical protein